MTENEIAKIVFETGLEIHKQLGPGLLESTYETCMAYELVNKGLHIQQQKGLPVIYKDVKLEIGYRVDILIENKFIVEIKSVDALNNIHLSQVLTYLKLSGCILGMLINFNTLLFKDGVKRVIQGDLL